MFASASGTASFALASPPVTKKIVAVLGPKCVLAVSSLAPMLMPDEPTASPHPCPRLSAGRPAGEDVELSPRAWPRVGNRGFCLGPHSTCLRHIDVATQFLNIRRDGVVGPHSDRAIATSGREACGGMRYDRSAAGRARDPRPLRGWRCVRSQSRTAESRDREQTRDLEIIGACGLRREEL